MPCISDYLESTWQEKAAQRTAKLLVYACRQLGVTPEPWAVKEAKNCYANDRRLTPALCKLLGDLPSRRRDALVYNARDKMSRHLADWWEKHQKMDRKRERQEAKDRKAKQLRDAVVSRLTPQERKAVGL